MTWKQSEIRSARQAHLKPILENLGYRLKPLKNGNYEVCGLSRPVIIKDNYWLCTDNQSAGNVIDFCTKILNMSFRQAMNIIIKETSYDVTGNNVRSQREKTGGSIQS